LGLLPGSQYAVDIASEDPLRVGPKDHVPEPAEWATTALVSADFDSSVDMAVRSFQEQRGITVDGVVGPETFRRLEEARWRLGDRVLSFAAAHPTVGEDVLELQQRLNAMGFLSGREDGHLGPETDKGLRDFQRNVGIRVDGVCGPATFRSLGQLNRTAGRHSSQTVREKYSLPELRTGVRGKIVVLDPAAVPEVDQVSIRADLCSDLASRIEGQLSAVGTRVLVTRSLSDPPSHSSSEADRAEFCNEVGADLVLTLSILDDVQQQPGAATYFYGRDGGTISVPGHLAAQLILEGITERTALPNRAKHPKTWDMLRLTRMPTVRIVCGNVAHHDDSARLNDQQFIEDLARAIADSVERFFSPEHVL